MEAEVTAFSEVAWFCFVGYGIEHVATPREASSFTVFPHSVLYIVIVFHICPGLHSATCFYSTTKAMPEGARGCQRMSFRVPNPSRASLFGED